MIQVCTRGGWGFSTTSGQSPDGLVISAYRSRPVRNCFGGVGRMVDGQLSGVIVKTYEEASRLGLLYGYLQPFGRNTMKWVMSRAARRRGYTTTNPSYHGRAGI